MPGERLAKWTDYAVVARYPGFSDEKSEEDLPALLKDAEAVLGKVRQATAAG